VQIYFLPDFSGVGKAWMASTSVTRKRETMSIEVGWRCRER